MFEWLNVRNSNVTIVLSENETVQRLKIHVERI